MPKDIGEQQPERSEVQGEKNKKKVDITATKVVAGALASITAAVAGSQLGVAGTISGAALVSIVSTVGTALYQAPLERTKNKVRHRVTLNTAPFRQRNYNDPPSGGGPSRPTSRVPMAQAPNMPRPDGWRPNARSLGGAQPGVRSPTSRSPTSRPPAGPRSANPQPASPDQPTRRISRPAWQGDPNAPTRMISPSGPPDRAEQPPTKQPPGKPVLRWGLLAAGAALVFLISMLSVTGIELVNGRAIAGGPQGSTTVGLVAHAKPMPNKNVDRPDQQPGTVPSQSPEPSLPGSGDQPTSHQRKPTTSHEQPAPTTTQRDRIGQPPTTAPTTTQEPAQPQPTGPSGSPNNPLLPNGPNQLNPVGPPSN